MHYGRDLVEEEIVEQVIGIMDPVQGYAR